MKNLSLKNRLKYRMRPLKALRHFRNLMANKEDTTQVFHIIKALNGARPFKVFERFLETPEGKARFQERRYLPPLLDNHAELAKLPKNTVGRAYLHFMQSQGLTAQGLVDEYARFESSNKFEGSEDFMWFANRLRDTHDLLHVFTGYSRDALGEACVLGFTYSQDKNIGARFIAYMAALEIKKSVPSGAPVLAAIKQGEALGRAAVKIYTQDIMALMEEDLESARKRLNVGTPTRYFEVHDMLRTNNIDPFGLIAAA